MYGGDIVHKDIYTELLDALPEGQVQWSEAVSSDQTLPFSGQLSTKLSDVAWTSPKSSPSAYMSSRRGSDLEVEDAQQFRVLFCFPILPDPFQSNDSGIRHAYACWDASRRRLQESYLMGLSYVSFDQAKDLAIHALRVYRAKLQHYRNQKHAVSPALVVTVEQCITLVNGVTEDTIRPLQSFIQQRKIVNDFEAEWREHFENAYEEHAARTLGNNSVALRSLADSRSWHTSARGGQASSSLVSDYNSLVANSIASLNSTSTRSQAFFPFLPQEQTNMQRISKVLSSCISLEGRIWQTPRRSWSYNEKEKYRRKRAQYVKQYLATRYYQKLVLDTRERTRFEPLPALDCIVDFIRATVTMYHTILRNDIDKTSEDPKLKVLEKACECIRFRLDHLRKVANGHTGENYRCICDMQGHRDQSLGEYRNNIPACAEIMWEELHQFHGRFQMELSELAKDFSVAR